MTYSSKPKHKSERKRKEEEICQLAQDSFKAFEPFINLFDCGLKGYSGIKGLDGPFHLITKEDWRLFARHKAGERKLHYAGGRKFNPYLAVNCNVFSAKHVHQHIKQHKATYFTSGKRGLGLLYLDVDAHHAWQTDEYRAKEVLQQIFPDGYFRASWRGQNGYLKVRYQTIEQFNAVARSLQKTLGRLFLQLGILCDIEVKGTITHQNKSGSLGKLPFQDKCKMRDETDSWNYPQLRKFQACPIINARRVQHVIGGLESKLDDEWISLFAQEKQLLKDRAKQEQEDNKLKETTKPAPPAAPTQAPVQQPLITQPVVRSIPTTIHISLPVAKSEDAFVRNQQNIRTFVRAFWKEHKRFPTTDETLNWMKINNRYSGEWAERENERAKRVEQILAYTERGFDPQRIS